MTPVRHAPSRQSGPIRLGVPRRRIDGRGEHPSLGGGHHDPRTGERPHAFGETEMIGVVVGDDDRRDVGQRPSGRPHRPLDAPEVLRGVPPGVDQMHPIVADERVGERAGESPFRDRHGDAPETVAEVGRVAQETGFPGVTLGLIDGDDVIRSATHPATLAIACSFDEIRIA